MLRYLTAGESHGPALLSIVEGLPAGLKVKLEDINQELARRQLGYGRGGRMAIEKDTAQFLSGIRFGQTLGSPVSILIENRDWMNWQDRMSQHGERFPGADITQPRPGHADLVGALKTDQDDIRNILERSSARETASRVAAGALAKILLREFGIEVISHVTVIGSVTVNRKEKPLPVDMVRIDASEVRCLDEAAGLQMINAIKKTRDERDTIGGVFEVLVYGCPPGLGSYASWETRIDGRIARAVMAIQAIKGVEIGDGFSTSERAGSQAHDEIYYDNARGYYRNTNHAGGIEGGMTNGEAVVIRAAMKPIPTLMKPLHTVDIKTKKDKDAVKERSDVCAVPAAAVVAEAVIAFEIATAFLDKFGSDALSDMKAAYNHYMERIR